MEAAAIGRLRAALARSLADNGYAAVSLALLGAALAAPTGGRYDDADPGDRALAARILAVFARRLHVFGLELRRVPVAPEAGHRVQVWRTPASTPLQPGSWGQVGSRGELARWARRAGQAAPDAGRALLRVLGTPPEEADPTRVEMLKAALPCWPPPLVLPDGRRLDGPRRPDLLRRRGDWRR